MWHVWNTAPYLRRASPLSFYLPWWFTLTQLPQEGKMFIYLWQKWHWVTSCHSVIILCLWSRELSDNREMFQPSSASPMDRPCDGCKIDSTYGYLAQACSTSQAFFGETSQLILFYDLKFWGWMAKRVGRGRPASKWKFQRTSKFPGGPQPRLSDTGRGRERGVGIKGRGLKT